MRNVALVYQQRQGLYSFNPTPDFESNQSQSQYFSYSCKCTCYNGHYSNIHISIFFSARRHDPHISVVFTLVSLLTELISRSVGLFFIFIAITYGVHTWMGLSIWVSKSFSNLEFQESI